jgi:hypothetical protein
MVTRIAGHTVLVAGTAPPVKPSHAQSTPEQSARECREGVRPRSHSPCAECLDMARLIDGNPNTLRSSKVAIVIPP